MEQLHCGIQKRSLSNMEETITISKWEEVVYLQLIFTMASLLHPLSLIHTRKISWLVGVRKSSSRIFLIISNSQTCLNQVYLTIIKDQELLLSAGIEWCHIFLQVLARTEKLLFGI
jgi:hypothetical protein